MQAAVDAANATVSSAEGIKRFRILPVDLTEASGHLTPTLKIKRNVVLTDFADDLEALYAAADPDPGHGRRRTEKPPTEKPPGEQPHPGRS